MKPFEDFSTIRRYPHNETLKAWDAADELVLEELATYKDILDRKILILNDSFGALSIALGKSAPLTYTDSYVSSKGMSLNAEGLKVIHDLSDVRAEFDLVIVKIPKSLSFFEDILATLNQCLAPQTPVIFSSMVKYMVKGQFDLIQEYLGETRTSLAKKKARLIFCEKREKTQAKKENPYPKSIFIEEMKREFLNHSNLFSRHKLDIGTRFFLEHIPCGDFKSIVDLGCANGIVGIKAKLNNPHALITFTDDSYMAIKSAQHNYDSHSFADRAQFLWTNCFETGEANSQDLVLCNPPFHQNQTVGTHIAFQMFKDAKRALRKGGFIRVIGNSHLGYQHTLKKIFGNSKIVAQNKKFLIIDAFRQ